MTRKKGIYVKYIVKIIWLSRSDRAYQVNIVTDNS